jgi:hypothetical protein
MNDLFEGREARPDDLTALHKAFNNVTADYGTNT